MVRGEQALFHAVVTGGVDAGGVAEERRAPRFVEGRPHAHPIAQGVVHVERVLGEAGCRVAVRPPALLLQRLRQIPVVEGEPGQDARIQQLVDETLVEVDTGRVHRAAVGPHARPRRREAIGVQAHVRHERDVVAVEVVVIAGDVAVVAVDHGVGHPAERVPDRVATTVLAGRTFDLEGRGGGAEQEVRRERARGGGHPGGVLSGGGGGHGAHPFTAPAMMPLTSCLPTNTKRINRGMVASSTPARTME